MLKKPSATILALALILSFISLISLSTSSMNSITKSTNLCFLSSSVFLFVTKKLISYPVTGFLRRITKDSALCIRNLVNLCARIRSISSACLILILILIELIEGSIRTFSFSFREMVRGRRMISVERSEVRGDSISGML